MVEPKPQDLKPQDLTPQDLAEADPKGLIRESYAMEGLGEGECRSIFMDWALSLPAGVQSDAPLRRLIGHYARAHPDHPMSAILIAALAPADGPRRRGGHRGRLGSG